MQALSGNRVADTEALNHSEVSGIVSVRGTFGQNCKWRVPIWLSPMIWMPIVEAARIYHLRGISGASARHRSALARRRVTEVPHAVSPIALGGPAARRFVVRERSC